MACVHHSLKAYGFYLKLYRLDGTVSYMFSPSSTKHPRSAQPVKGQAAPWRDWTALALLMFPVLLVAVDNTALTFALPEIARSLDVGGVQLLWIVDATRWSSQHCWCPWVTWATGSDDGGCSCSAARASQRFRLLQLSRLPLNGSSPAARAWASSEPC